MGTRNLEKWRIVWCVFLHLILPAGRHTSFCSVEVMPELMQKFIEVEINPDDLKVDVYRAVLADSIY